jgi:hypothetical protein
LHGVLGKPPSQLQHDDLVALVAAAVREADDLDFKESLYGNSDRDRGELAADIAGFANARGGVILIGIAERDGAAISLESVPVSDGEEQRMTQIIAGLVVPYIDVAIRRIDSPTDTGQGFYVLVIPPSASRPHAVSRNGSLRYPRRDGTTRRWLAEAEIADLYRDRFRETEDAASRVERIIDEVVAGLAPDAHQPSVVVGLVPTASTNIPNDTRRLREIEMWAGQFTNGELDGFLHGSPPVVRAGQRRARLFDNFDARPPKFSYAELHTDGAAAASTWLQVLDARGDETDLVLPWDLIRGTARCLNVIVRHAVEHAGAYGDVLCELRVLGPDPLRLARVQFGSIKEPVTDATPLPIVSRHTLAGDALPLGSPQTTLATARLLLTDVVQAMGHPEILEVRADGALVGPDDPLRRWAEANRVAVA